MKNPGINYHAEWGSCNQQDVIYYGNKIQWQTCLNTNKQIKDQCLKKNQYKQLKV